MKNIKLRIVYLILGSALLLSALFVLAVNVIIPSHFVNEAKKALLNEAEYQNRAIPYAYDEPDYDEDWEEGYENVTVCCTCENQEMADFRLPIYASLPIRRKIIICEPLLGAIDLRRYLAIREKGGIPMIRELVCGGESGNDARICDYGWILSLREQCLAAGVPFRFRQTGALFRKDGRLYRIPRRLQHAQARKAGIDTD